MTKKEVTEKMAEKFELTGKKSSEIVNWLTDVVKDSLKTEKKVTIFEFGTFTVKERAEHNGRNPQTGETILLPKTNTIKFKPSSTLKELVNK